MQSQVKGDKMDLLHRIHSENTPSSLEANLASYVNEIKTFLDDGGGISSSSDATFAERYYINHIGRELNTQIIRFDLEKYFKYQGGHGGITLDNPYGGGYRPDSNASVYASAGGGGAVIQPVDSDGDGTPDDQDDFPTDASKSTFWTPQSIYDDLLGWWDTKVVTNIHDSSGALPSTYDGTETAVVQIDDISDYGATLIGNGSYNGNRIRFTANNSMQTQFDYNSGFPSSATFFIVANISAVDALSDSVMSYRSGSSLEGSWQMDAADNSKFFARVKSQGLGDTLIETKNPSNVGYGHPSAVGLEGSTHIFSVRFDLSNFKKEVFVDGSNRGSSATPSIYGLSGSVLPSGGFRIFVNRNGQKYPEGDFHEAVIVEGNDTSVIQKVEGYLAHKWNISSSLPSGHPYKSSAPGT